jgi:hypothetical protein
MAFYLKIERIDEMNLSITIVENYADQNNYEEIFDENP